MKKCCWVWVLLAHCCSVHMAFAQKRWTGNAGTAYWNDPLNWEGEVLPSDADHVLLDNSYFSSSYEVILPDDEVAVQTLEIAPSGNVVIQLLLPVSNSVASAAGATGAKAFATRAGGYSLVLRKNAVFVNASGSASGYSVYFNDSIRIENGAKYVHRTRTGHADILNRLSRLPGTELGVFRMENTDASSTLSISGREFGSLELSGEMSPTGNSTYSASGTNPVRIRGNLVLDNGSTLSLHFGDTIHVYGDLSLKNAVLNLSTGNRSSCIRLYGNWMQEQSIVQETNSTGETGTILLSGNVQQQISISGEIRDSIRWVLDNPDGAVVAGLMELPHELVFNKGILFMSASPLYLKERAFITLSDSGWEVVGARPLGIEGSVVKQFAPGEPALLPLVKNGVMGFINVKGFVGELEAEYHRGDPNILGQQLGAELAELSTIEYWRIQTNGSVQTDDPLLEFSFSEGRSGAITDPGQLTVAAYANGQWQSAGQNLVMNSTGNGGYIQATAYSGTGMVATHYTLANKTAGANVLPTLLDRSWLTRGVNRWEMHWIVRMPELVECFELEVSDDGNVFRKLARVPAQAGQAHYSQLLPLKTERGFYRLRIVQYDAREMVGPVLRIASFGRQEDFHASLVPANNGVKLYSRTGGEYELAIYSQSGHLLANMRCKLKAGTAFYALPARFPSSGSVIIRITDESGMSKTVQQGW